MSADSPTARGGLAAFWCGLASAAAALLAGLFYLGWPPGATSGESMLLLIFGAFPLALAGLTLALWRRASGRRALVAAGAALALLTLVVVLLVVALVWLSWTRCAGSCL
jgi:hypothetical protein